MEDAGAIAQREAATAEEAVSKSRRLLRRATIFSMVWIAACLCVLVFSAGRAGENYLGNIVELKPNEWGDFFAGVFSPLAFVWLVATVWIQHDEYRMQQEELAQTRREFELNRKVLQSQAEEAKKQAEYIGTQTDILKREEAKRASLENDVIFNAHLLELSRRLIKHNNAFLATVDKTQKYLGVSLSADEYDEYDIVRDMSFEIIDIVDGIKSVNFSELRVSDPNTMQIVTRYIRICEQRIDNMSPGGKARADILRLPDLLLALMFLLDKDQETQRLQYSAV